MVSKYASNTDIRSNFLLIVYPAVMLSAVRSRMSTQPHLAMPRKGAYGIHNFPPLSRKRGDIKSHLSLCPSVCPSVCHKNFNLGNNFCTITYGALIFSLCVLCDKAFLMVPFCDLDSDLWPTSRSNLLPSGGPQFSEFACYFIHVKKSNTHPQSTAFCCSF